MQVGFIPRNCYICLFFCWDCANSTVSQHLHLTLRCPRLQAWLSSLPATWQQPLTRLKRFERAVIFGCIPVGNLNHFFLNFYWGHFLAICWEFLTCRWVLTLLIWVEACWIMNWAGWDRYWIEMGSGQWSRPMFSPQMILLSLCSVIFVCLFIDMGCTNMS